MAQLITILIYAQIPGVIGYFGLKAARKGESKSKVFMIVMDVLAVLANVGAYAHYGSLGIEDFTMIIVAAIFTVLIIGTGKKS